MQDYLKVSHSPEPLRPQAPPVPQARPAERVGGVAPGSTAPPRSEAPPQHDARQMAEEVDRAMKRMSDYIQTVNRNLQFTLDEESGRTIIRVIDAETDEVIRQIPPEEILALARHLRDDGSSPVLIEANT